MTEDEVGRIEEEEKEAATTRARGRPKKRTRLTPGNTCASVSVGAIKRETPADLLSLLAVRKSARVKMMSAKQEDSSSNPIQPDRDASAPPGDVQPEMQRTEGEAAGQDVDAAKHQPESECPDDQIPSRFAVGEEEQEEHVRADLNGNLIELTN